jgi:hypothetical protein
MCIANRERERRRRRKGGREGVRETWKSYEMDM